MSGWTSRFRVVSFYTPDYKRFADGLARSMDEHMPETQRELVAIPQRKWAAATCYKAEFMRDRLADSDRGVLWIDADALVCQPFRVPDVDLALYARFADKLRAAWSPFRTGTVYLGQTAEGRDIADAWARECREQADGIDQWALFRAWQSLMVRGGAMPATYFLPLDYCRKVNESGPVKIQHLMASRTLRHSK